MKKALNLFLYFLTLVFALTGVKYFFSSSLEVYDASSHLAAASYLKDRLWPFFSGWNPTNLLGFDQGLFYPSLLHWLGATGGFVIGVENSLKLLLTISLILLPLSVLYWARTITNDRGKHILILSLTASLVIILPGYFGADVKALLQVGLLPSFLSLFLLFFYLGILNKLNEENWMGATLLLSAVILTHLVAGVVASLFLLGRFGQKLFEKKVERLALLHLITTFLLTCFFTIPFLINSSFLSQSAHPNSLGWNLLVFLGSLGFSYYFLRKKRTDLVLLSGVVVFLSFLTSSDFVVERFVKNSFIFDHVYSFHFYRYQVYEILFLVPLVGSAIFKLLAPLNEKLKLAFFLTPLVVVLLYVVVKPVFLEVQSVQIKPAFNGQGRFLESFPRTLVDPYTYTVQNKLVDQGLPWAYGLFTDATPNGPYLSSLIRSLNPENYPPVDQRLIENQIIEPAKIPDVEDLFAINKLLILEPTGNKIAQIQIGSAQRSFYLNPLNSSASLAEVIPSSLELKTVNKDWSSQVLAWWKEPRLTSLLVKTKESLITAQNSEVVLLSHNSDWSKFSLQVKAKQKVPTLVKFTYLPNWHAYQNGKEISIYQVSPDLMLVNAMGVVDFEYKTGFLQTLTMIVSLLALLMLVIIIIRSYVQNQNPLSN